MATHNHLDRQRRQRGDCPACDDDWDAQDAWLAAGAPSRTVITQLERMAERPKPLAAKFCTASAASRLHTSGTHLCGKLATHRGPHFCPLCDQEW